MIIVVFEETIKEGMRDNYMSIAAKVRKAITGFPGFISIEHSISPNDNNKAISISQWENEEAIENWKNNSQHKIAQAIGK